MMMNDRYKKDDVIIIDNGEEQTSSADNRTMLINPTDEEPLFFIEDDDDGDGNSSRKKPLSKTILTAAALIVLLAVAYAVYHKFFGPGITGSATPKENIEKLKAPAVDETPEVAMTTDTAAGIRMNMYELRGLKASIEFREPSQSDKNVYLYSASADWTADKTYIGSLVANGEEKPSTGVSRLGYFASANGNEVIGIAKSEAVKDYAKEQGGHFFRQFILVYNGRTPLKFHLHGKVERRALAMTREDITDESGMTIYDSQGKAQTKERLYYVATTEKTTLEDFANALKTYGFTDAIYMTGGNACSYYRDSSGTRHDIGDTSKRTSESKRKKTRVTPFLVWRKQ